MFHLFLMIYNSSPSNNIVIKKENLLDKNKQKQCPNQFEAKITRKSWATTTIG
jgi:hypothetical protein